MTTPLESVQLIKYLRDHRFIGEHCWADSDETTRDHDGWECGIEVAEYDYWERAMRDRLASYLVEQTYFQIRRLAWHYWGMVYRGGNPAFESAGNPAFEDDAIDSLFQVSDGPAYQARASELEIEYQHHHAHRILNTGEENSGPATKVTDIVRMAADLQARHDKANEDRKPIIAKILGNMRNYLREHQGKPSGRHG